MNATLYRDLESSVGLSLAGGEGMPEVLEVSDLPPHRVEIHRFWQMSWAAFFVEGLAVAAGNTVAYRREVDHETGNLVLVAFLAEDRPEADTVEEAVRVVEHRPSGDDGRVVARHLREGGERDRMEREARRTRVEPVLLLLAEHGLKARYDGNTGPTVYASPRPSDHDFPRVGVTPTADNLWTVNVDFAEPSGGDSFHVRNPDPRLVDLIRSAGLDWSDYPADSESKPMSLADIPAFLEAVALAWETIKVVLLEMWRETTARRQAEVEEQRKAASRARRLGRPAPKASAPAR